MRKSSDVLGSKQCVLESWPNHKITNAEKQMALVDVSGVNEKSAWSVVDDYHPLERCVGHWTLVHVGFGMSLINEDEAEATLKVLRRAWRSARRNSRR